MFYYLLTKKGRVLFNLKHIVKISVEGKHLYFITGQTENTSLYAAPGQYKYEYETEESALKEFEMIQKKVEELK